MIINAYLMMMFLSLSAVYCVSYAFLWDITTANRSHCKAERMSHVAITSQGARILIYTAFNNSSMLVYVFNTVFWKLKAVDSLGDFRELPEEERNKIFLML
jgi:hypothetical protein